jgi:parallel beta-helix repeat protein
VAVVKKAASKTVLLLILCLVYMLSQFVNLGAANPLPPPGDLVQVYIRADGSVEPSTAPIQRFGNVYVFTGNLLHYSIDVQCDNIVIDGSGFILQGYGIWDTAIKLSNRTNVLIKNVDIRSYWVSVSLYKSSNNTIANNSMLTLWNVILDSSSNNQITGNSITGQETGYGYGIQVNSGSSNNSIIGNSFTDTGIGVTDSGDGYNIISGNYFIRGGTNVLAGSCYNTISKNIMVDGRSGIAITTDGSYNTIFGNNITGKSKCCIEIYWGSRNTVYENYITNSSVGVKLGIDHEYPDRKVENNVFYHNNFINNTYDGYIGYGPNSNSWNNGKKGNYWSNYSGTDRDGDGRGDTPYIIDRLNKDYSPLMNPIELSEPEVPVTVPEFPSELVLWLILASSLTIVLFKKKMWGEFS